MKTGKDLLVDFKVPNTTNISQTEAPPSVCSEPGEGNKQSSG